MGKRKQKEIIQEDGISQQGQFPAGAAPLSGLDLSDGFLFGEVMWDEETCRTVLEIILRRPVSRVVYVNKEQQVEAGT